jgi:uncharacterized protein
MRRGVVLAAVAFVLAAGDGRAASFDCGKPSAPQEKLICGSPELSERDDRLAAAYKAALAQLSEEGQRLLRDQQRAWLEQNRLECGPVGNEDGDAMCLMDAYDERIEGLEHAVTEAGPWRLMRSEERSGARQKPEDPDDAEPTYVGKTMILPRIDAPATAETERLNHAIAAHARELAADADALTNLHVGYQVTLARPELLSIAFYVERYRLGAAHPSDQSDILNLLPGQGRALAAADLFDAKPDWAAFLAMRAFAALKRQAAAEDWPLRALAPQEIGDVATSPARWAFSPAGLVIHFNAEEVTAAAAGDKDVVIPWDDLKPYLAAPPAFAIPPAFSTVAQ